MNKEKNLKEITTYSIEWFDNGITVKSEDLAIADCIEAKSPSRIESDDSLRTYLGKLFLEDINTASNILLDNKLKVTITIEKDE